MTLQAIPPFDRLVRLDPPLPRDARHPVLACRCTEGRLTNAHGAVIAWLPGVHDCAYIAAHNVEVRRLMPRDDDHGAG